jgi:pantoate--beta-alanine ligase
LRVVRDRRALAQALAELRAAGNGIGLVPTMGYLHAGHGALLARAAEDGLLPVLSIFVNPLQFGAGEDFARYPRDEAGDLAAAERFGAVLAYLPDGDDLVPERPEVVIRAPALMRRLDARARPGHFEGVAAVVVRLWGIVRPDAAYFGEKDAQQLAVVRRLARDLAVGVRVVGVPTVRDADGLALSSRNAYLSPGERRQALALRAALAVGEGRIAAGERRPAAVAEAMRRHLAQAPGVTPEYAEAVGPDRLDRPRRILGRTLLAVAARVGTARLIDNVRLWVPLDGPATPLVDDPPGEAGRRAQVARRRLEAVLAERAPQAGVAWRRAVCDALRGAAALDGPTVRAVLAQVVGRGPLGTVRIGGRDLDELAAVVWDAMRSASAISKEPSRKLGEIPKGVPRPQD